MPARSCVPSTWMDVSRNMCWIWCERRVHRRNAGLADLKPLIAIGASPRAGINLILAARGHAFIQGRGFVTPEDIKQIAPDVLRHRVAISYEAEAENVTSDDIVRRILDYTEVP